jgi:hypothetical protein
MLVHCRLLLAALLIQAGIGLAQESSLQVRSMEWTDSQADAGLRLRLDLRLAEEPLQALEQGVGLPFVLEWRACPGRCGAVVDRQRAELRYAPLLQRYLLRVEGQPPRQFAFRAALLGAFEQPLPLRLQRGGQWQLRVRLDQAELPAPLRLPARLRAAWQLDTDWQEVP